MTVPPASGPGMKARRGAILPLAAVILLGLIALLAFGIDSGSLQRHRRVAQNAADAAALAGAQEILRAHDFSFISAAARLQATKNGYTNGANHAAVLVTQPTSPDYFTGSNYVKVVIEDTVKTAFAAIIGRPYVVVRARAWGGIYAPSGDCLVALDPSASSAVEVKDNGTQVNATNCGIRINSNSTTAFSNTAGAVVDATGGTVAVTGGPATRPTGVSGAYISGVAPAPDPVGYLPMPTFSHSCDAAHTNKTVSTVGTTVLLPGVYCGGITVQNNGVNVQFSEGVYFLLGGGFNVKSGASVSSAGSGVTFVNTADATHAYDRINIQSAATITLNANTDPSNTLHGILFYQDPAVTGFGFGGSRNNNFQSGSGSTLTGTLYFPSQEVEFQSGSTMTLTGGVIASRISIHSGTTLTLIPASGGAVGYYAGKRASIVE